MIFCMTIFTDENPAIPSQSPGRLSKRTGQADRQADRQAYRQADRQGSDSKKADSPQKGNRHAASM